MTTLFASVNGQRVLSACLHVPAVGAWVLDVDLDTQAALSGAVEAQLGALTLRGTVAPDFSGSFGLASRYRVIGGAGGWSKRLAPKDYHNDAGIKLSTVALDAAREVGETLELQPGADQRVGIDFVRAAAPASLVLEQLLRGVPWWVDYDGITRVGARPQAEVGAGVELLDFDPHNKVATLAVDDLRAISIGSVLRARLPRPLVVRELEIQVDKGALRVSAWGQELETQGATRTRLLRSLRALVRKFVNDAPPCHDFMAKYRYRVVRMVANRAELQAVRKRARLPDTLPVSIHPGMAGLSAVLTPGALVLVEFIEGDPTQPIVTHFATQDEAGFLPVALTLDATEEVRIGAQAAAVSLGSGSAHVVRYGDTVSISGPNQVTGPITFTPGPPGPLTPSKVKA